MLSRLPLNSLRAKLPAMTAILTEKRHIVLPDVVETNALSPGQEYHVLISTTGVIMLRPKRRHQMSLLEHLRGFEGVELPRRREPIPAPIEL